MSYGCSAPVISTGCCGTTYGCSAPVVCGGCSAPVVCGGCGVSYVPSTSATSTVVYSAPVSKVVPAAEKAAAATIVVTLPADAKLTVGGVATKATSERRVFVSPELKPGRTYQYVFKAEVVRNGKPLSWEEKVTIEAGKEVKLNLAVPATALAAR